jgi:hypothetical protein
MGRKTTQYDLQQVLQTEAERRSQLQDWNVERKNLESRKQIGDFEKGDAGERSACSRCQWSVVELTSSNKNGRLYGVLFPKWNGWKRRSNSYT